MTIAIEVLGADQLDEPLMCAISELKALYWPYPVDSQLAWLKARAADRDLHVIARNRHAVMGYLRIPRRAADVDHVPGRICGVSTVVVHPGWREMGIARRLLRASIDVFEDGAVGLLQCRRNIRHLYEQADWREFFGTVKCRSASKEENFCRDEMMMIYTRPYREVATIVLDGDPF